MKAGNELGEV